MDEAEFWRVGLENFTNVITIIASLSTPLVAIWGIDSWKRQRKWERSNETGSELIRSIYTYNSAVLKVLRPNLFVSSIGVQTFSGKATAEEQEQSAYLEAKEHYYSLLANVDEAAADLKSHLQEASIYWKEESLDWDERLNELRMEMKQYVVNSLTIRNPSEVSEQFTELLASAMEGKREVTDVITNTWSALRQISEGEDTEFTREFLIEMQSLKSKVFAKMK